MWRPIGRREAWCRQIDAFDEASGRHRQLALFRAERTVPCRWCNTKPEARIERPVLPFPNLVKDGVGDPADEVGRDVRGRTAHRPPRPPAGGNLAHQGFHQRRQLLPLRGNRAASDIRPRRIGLAVDTRRSASCLATSIPESDRKKPGSASTRGAPLRNFMPGNAAAAPQVVCRHHAPLLPPSPFAPVAARKLSACKRNITCLYILISSTDPAVQPLVVRGVAMTSATRSLGAWWAETMALTTAPVQALRRDGIVSYLKVTN
jgi:hypothetical protein